MSLNLNLFVVVLASYIAVYIQFVNNTYFNTYLVNVFPLVTLFIPQ